MQIIRQWRPMAGRRPVVLAIGNFDGVHQGHRHLLEQVQASAKMTGWAAAAMTFDPHPLCYLQPQKPLLLLSSRTEKFRQLSMTGIDALYVLRFNRTLASLPADDFTAWLFTRLHVRHLIVGSNFRYGHRGQGDFDTLQQSAIAHNAVAEPVDLLRIGDAVVSSDRIRYCLQQADFDQAAQLLGRRWSLSGRVCRGAGRGRQWGFPTANLKLSFTPPCSGIYAARTSIGQRSIIAAVSIGTNPTVDNDGLVRVEAHLLDFNADIYGERLTLALTHKIREEKKYTTIDALKLAIADDVRQTRRLMNTD